MISAAPANLAPGRTMIINGLTGPVVVSSVVGTTITFTGNASRNISGAMCAWGTDNTTALNAFFDYVNDNNVTSELPAGGYLITNTVGWADNGTGPSSPTIYCGGACNYPARLSNMGLGGGTYFVWGGAANGQMVEMNRNRGLNWVGGITLCGQPSSTQAACIPASEISRRSATFLLRIQRR